MNVSLYKTISKSGVFSYYLLEKDQDPEQVIEEYEDMESCIYLFDRDLAEHSIVNYDRAVDDLKDKGYHKFTLHMFLHERGLIEDDIEMDINRKHTRNSKKSRNFRLSNYTISLLKHLSEKHNTSMTQIVEIAVAQFDERDRGKVG